MKNKNKSVALSLSFCIILGLLMQLFLPTVATAIDDNIYIESTEQFLEFAKKCSYDAYSEGKTFVLTADISLKDVEFEPIALFNGSFDGNGHTISGIDINGSFCPAGLFAASGKDAVIKNLTVEGVISPSGDKGFVGGIVGDNSGKIQDCVFNGTLIGKGDVGGIAGINRVSGSISGCTVSGEIIGENRTGGVAGSNDGLISASKSNAKVNTISLEPSLSIDEINLSLTLDISKLPSLSTGSMTDIGGIAGYSTGIIIGCLNNGSVGYPHIGYNVGGIVGRNCGHLSSNENSATINGRKDVGGIVGQMEPYVSYDLSEDLLASLKTELDRLGEAVNGAVNSTGNGIPTVSSRLDTILSNIDGATDSLDKIIQDGVGWGDDFLNEINRTAEIIGEVISQVSGITEEFPALSTSLSNSLGELESAFKNIEGFSSVNKDTLGDITEASKDAAEAFGHISESINSINVGLGALKQSLTIEDKDAAVEAIKSISDGLSSFIYATDEFTIATNEAIKILENTPWMDDAIDQICDLVIVFGNMSESLSVIYDATLDIYENIDVYWNKFEEAGDELVIAVGHLADMTESLADAIELMDSGITKIQSGLERIDSSLLIDNPDEVEKAIGEISLGINQLIDASAKMGTTLSAMRELVNSFDKDSEMGKMLSNLLNHLGELADSGINVNESIARLGSGLSLLLDNITIDFDGLEDGGALILGGVGSIADSMEHLKNAARSLSDGMAALENSINALNEAVNVKDEEKLSAALNQAYTALGDIINSTVELSVVLEDMTATLESATVWGKELTGAVSDITEALTKMSGALVEIQSGIDSLRENLSFDLNHASEGLSHIRNGLSKLGDASSGIKNSLLHISDAISKIDSGSELLNGAITDMKECIGGLKDVADRFTSISEKLVLLFDYLKGVDTIQLPTPPESITATANELFIFISAIETELKYLNRDMSDLGSELTAQIGKINEIFGNLSNNIVDMIYSLDDGSFVDNNVSEEEIDSVTQGKAFSCLNSGNVFGDINVGGICGSMALEYSLDPEDDLSVELSITQKKQYKLKAIIHVCKNTGDVTSKYDCAGGIVGKMDLGLIYGSESYSKVESRSGSYVGGIAGITSGLISQCFVKSSLCGNKYVGGIVGSGVSESYSGDSSMVRNCYSMVKIERFTQYAGAISGINIGEFSENMFVSDILAGIDRTSYLGKAEPISYEDLSKRRSLPDEFYRFTLEFLADGKLLSVIEFEYGSSFDSSAFPEIPKKNGYYGSWEVTELNNLTFDTSINVIYTPYTTAIGSGVSRDDGRKIFFVQGEFLDGDYISCERGCDTSSLILSDLFFTKDSLIESWTVVIPKDNLEVNNIHFLPTSDDARIFIKLDGIWQEVEATEFGSYLTFGVSGEAIEIAVVEHSIKLLPVILLCAGALIILTSVIIVCVIVRKKKTKISKVAE